MAKGKDLFAGDDPFGLAQAWLTEAEAAEPNDANAVALATADKDGLPNVRMVLLKEIEPAKKGGGGFVFYTNHEGAKGRELARIREALARHRFEPAISARSPCLKNTRPVFIRARLGPER